MKILNKGILTRKFEGGGDLIPIHDPRKIRATTGLPINPNRDLVNGKYSKENIGQIIDAARRYNVDPMTLVAMDLSETQLGKTDFNVGHTLMDSNKISIPSRLKQDQAGTFDGSPNTDIFARSYLQKMKDADRLGITDPATRLQTYNGLGKVGANTERKYYGHANKSFYGVPVPEGGIDLRTNPLYGKQIIDLRDNVLNQNPALQKYVANRYNNPKAVYDPNAQKNYIPTSQPTWPPTN
jgi:hypothetical protein